MALEKKLLGGHSQMVYLIGDLHLNENSLPKGFSYDNALQLIKSQAATIQRFFASLKHKNPDAYLIIESVTREDYDTFNKIRLAPFYTKCTFEGNPTYCQKNTVENQLA